MAGRVRRTHTPEFKARVAFAAVGDDWSVSLTAGGI
jgi:transposase-like protein